MHAITEDLGAAARQALQSGLFHIEQHFFQRFLGSPLDLRDLDHGERFQVRVGARFLHGAQNLQIIGIGKSGIDPAHHVDLGDRQISIRPESILNLFGRENVSAVGARFDVERAEPAQLVADVGVVDMLVANEVGVVAILSLAHDVG